MMSKNSFFKILLSALKDRMWGIALSCIGFFFAFPVYGALCAASIRNEAATSIIKPGCEAALYARDALGENNLGVFVAVIVLGVVLAFNGFSYLYSRPKVDLLHSAPIKRDTLFAAEYLAGFITFIVPYIAGLLLSVLVGAVNGMLGAGGFVSAGIMLGINILGFLGVYNTAIIAIILTGNMAVGILGTMVFFFYGIVCRFLFTGYQTAFFKTVSDYSISGVTYPSVLTMFSSLTDGMGSYRGEYDLKPGSFAVFIVYTAATLIISVFLFRMRASESAGRSIAFKWAMPVISVLLLIPASLAGGLIFEQFAGGDIENAYGWFIFGFAIALILGHFVIQAIYYLDFKSLLKNPVCPAIAGGIGAVIALVFILDLTGYDTYIPADSAYESAAICSYAMQGNIEYYDFDAVEDDEYGGRNVSLDPMDYRLDNIRITDKALVRDFVTAAIADTKGFDEKNADYDSEYNTADYIEDGSMDTDVVYDEAASYVSLTVKYNMNNGREVYRTYNMDLLAHMDLYDRLYADDEYKSVVCPMSALDETDADNIRYMNIFYTASPKFSDEDMAALVKAYKADVKEQTATDLKNEVPFGYLYKNVAYRYDSYTAEYCADRAYIYPSFKRTIAILKKYDVNLDYYKDPDNIAGIEVTNYDETDENGNSLSQKYTDAEHISAILEGSYPTELVNVEASLMPAEYADLSVCFKNSPGEYSSLISYTCLRGKMPEDVMEAVGMSK